MENGGELEGENTFAVIGASIAENFDVDMPEGTIGHSILEKISIKICNYSVATVPRGVLT